MSTTRKSPPTTKRVPKSEWLATLDALDRLMKSRISEEDWRGPRSKNAFSPRILATLNEAYAATLRYYLVLFGGGGRNLKDEAAISGLWRQTGRLLRHHDPALAALLTSRKGFWSEDSTWSTATIQKAWASLNSIRVSANIMAPDRKAIGRWSS